jgi:hypothetical protein
MRSAVEQVLAVVEDQQKLPVAQVRDEDVQRLGSGLVPEVQCCQDCIAHNSRIADISKLDQPGAVCKATREIGSRTKCEARLPDAAWSDEADEPSRRKLGSDLAKLASASDKCRRFRRQVA